MLRMRRFDTREILGSIMRVARPLRTIAAAGLAIVGLVQATGAHGDGRRAVLGFAGVRARAPQLMDSYPRGDDRARCPVTCRGGVQG